MTSPGKMKILISDSLSTQGVELLQKTGFTVVVKSKMPKEELYREIKDADGLIVRSGEAISSQLFGILGVGEVPHAAEGRLVRQRRTDAAVVHGELLEIGQDA